MLEIRANSFNPSDVTSVIASLGFQIEVNPKQNYFFAVGKAVDGKLSSPVKSFDWKLSTDNTKLFNEHAGRYLLLCGELQADFNVKIDVAVIAETTTKIRSACVRRSDSPTSMMTKGMSFFIFTGIYTINALVTKGKYLVAAITDAETDVSFTAVVATDKELEVGSKYRLTGTLTASALLGKSNHQALIKEAEAPESNVSSRRAMGSFLFRNSIYNVIGW